MKLWILNNTKFGYKNNSKEWSKNMIDYFENFFTPFIKKYAKPGDKLIHLGNIFNSTETINIPLLLTVRDLFIKINDIIPVVIVDGYDEKTGISTILKTMVVDKTFTDSGLHYIAYGSKVLDTIDGKDVVFLNSRIDKDILKKFTNTLFFCGYHDDRLEDDNIIQVGAPYQFNNTSDDKSVQQNCFLTFRW